MPWKPLPLSYAVAIYPFQPSASPTELPLQIGDQLYVIEQGGKDGAWCRGYLVAPPTLLSALTPGGRTAADARVFSGIFPKCCIEIREQLGPEVSVAVRPGEPKPQAPVPMLKIGDDSPTSSTEPLVDEISSCLREWYILHLPDLVLRREYHVLDQMSEIISRLDYARRELLNDVLTAQERLQVRNDAVWDLVRGNKMLSGEVIVRDATQQGRLLTSEDSAIEMTKLQAIMSVLDSPPSEKSRATSLHHCLVEVISVVGSDLESASLNLALYRNDSDGSPVSFSETYSSVASAKMKTLFSDLSTRDIGDAGETFLTVKVTISEPPRKAKRRAPERPPSRNGTLLGQRQLSLNRRRSSLMFGKRKHAERPHPGVNGRATPQTNERAQTPSIAEEEDGSSPAQGPPVPRTIAVGILDVNKIMRDNKSVEETITMWSVSARDDEKTREVDPRIKQLLNSQGRSLVVSPYISSVALRLTPYTAPDADTMIKNNPTSMHLVTKSQKIGFSEAPSKPRSDIYLRLSKAVITQGAHLSHPELNVAPIKAQSMQNLQLTMEVRDSSGRRIEHCIYPSANGAAVTALRTNAVEIDSAWDQTLCLRVPTEKVPDSHLILSIADAPEFPFALAWMPLWDKKAFISDGNHSLILHAYDKITSSVVQGRGAYLSLPWNNATYKTVHEGSYANIASLEVNTLLCSTEYSQDRTLVSLINWKHQTSVQLLDILQKLTFVQEIEIVKQLQDVLDALFGVLVHKSGESKFEDLIFNDIVWVLGIVHDRRYNLGPLVEQYTESHFRSPYAASCLIRSFTRLLQSVSDPQSARDMRALFKVGRTFMKIVITSYQQRRFGSQTNENRDEKHSTFKQDMQAILFGLQMMMRSETAALVGSKTLLVREFHTWLPELLPAFSKEEVIRTSIDFIDSCEDATGKLVLYRLILIHNYTKLDQIWVDDRDKKMLVKNCVRWLSPYWIQNDLSDDWHEQVRLSCSIVAELTRIPTHYLHEFMPKLISAYEIIAQQPSVRRRSLSFLFPDSYPFVNRATDSEDSFDEALLELSATVATIARMKAPSVPKIQGQELSEYVLSTLTMLRSLLQHHACPSTWLSLHIYHHSCALTILNYLSTLLISLYLPSPEEAENPDQADSFNLKMSLWKSFLDTLLMLVSSPALALELFPEQKRRAVWKISGDVRQSGADLLRNCWESLGWEATADDQRRYNIRRLGGYQVQYVPSLVAPTIRLCLSMHEGLRKVAVEILQAMIINEWALSDGESLELIETEVIGALNSIIKAKPVSANEAMSRKIFIAELLELFSTIANQPDDALWTAIEDLVATIDELVDLLTTTEADEEVDGEPQDPSNGHARGQSGDSQNSEAKELARARRSIDGLTPTSPAQGREKEYGVHALECYKQLAEEYERNGDYKRLAKTYRAIARIHEARAASRAGAGGLMNGRRAYGEQNADGEEEDDD